MSEQTWNCPVGIPELRQSELRKLDNVELLDRYHALRRAFEETCNEVTARWLDKEARK
jgi:hypothetical protein